VRFSAILIKSGGTAPFGEALRRLFKLFCEKKA
jgi:hypothetical protein